MALIADRPGIAYGSGSPQKLHYISALDPEGSAWNSPQQVSSLLLDAQNHFALAEVGGQPAIASGTAFGGEEGIFYFRGLDADGQQWSSPGLLDANDGSTSVSLATIAGRPALAYFALQNFELRFMRAGDALGQSWPEPTVLDSGSIFSPALAEIDGRAAIAFTDFEYPYSLYYLSASDTAAQNWNSRLKVAQHNHMLLDVALTLAGGRPAIASRSSGWLMYASSSDNQGLAWDNPLLVDSELSGSNLSLATLADGQPAMAYSDIADGLGGPGFDDVPEPFGHLRFQAFTP